MTLVTCQMDPTSSPALHSDTGRLNLLTVFTVMVKTNLLLILSAILTAYKAQTLYTGDAHASLACEVL